MDKNTELWQKLVDKCRHFNGTINKTCDAGVKYPKNWSRLPCRGTTGMQVDVQTVDIESCNQYSPYTEDEAKAKQKEAEESFLNIITARAAIIQHVAAPLFGTIEELSDNQWQQLWGRSGRLLCPICKTDTLFYSISRSNGHIHATCNNLSGCVSWME